MIRFIAWLRVCWRGLTWKLQLRRMARTAPPLPESYTRREYKEPEPEEFGSSPRPGVRLSDAMTKKLQDG